MNKEVVIFSLAMAIAAVSVAYGIGRLSHKPVSDLANICARSKANVELLNLCGETPGCMYTKKEIQETVRSVAACELAKETP